MDTRLIALNKVLDVLNVPAQIGSLDARKLVQKAIYLAQASGLQLGYGYGWYLRGPYSTSLARDYYAMAAALRLGEGATGNLRHDVVEQLEPVRNLAELPAGWNLSHADWLELLASVHFLRTVRGLNKHRATDVLRKEKPTLAPHETSAALALQRANLLP